MLRIEELSIVTPGGETLVDATSLDLQPGEFVVLIGPSGSGKTSVANVLCGLIGGGEDGWETRGRLVSGARNIDLAESRSDLCGLVFQGNALFDDLSAGENLAIAADHAEPGGNRAEALLMLLSDIVPGKPIAACSGGQKQRIAIARTLLAHHPVLVLDEPNSGLDIKSSRRLSSILKEICREGGTPALVVAHHFEDLLPLADRVLLLDSGSRTIRDLKVELVAIEDELMAMETGVGRPQERAGEQQAAWQRSMRRRAPARWFLRYFAEYFWVLCASPFMLAYVVLGGMIVGFVSIWFGFNYHSFGGYLRAILHDETLAGLGFVQMTVGIPLIASILVIARNSAVISADLSNRVLSAQFRAMTNLNIPANRYIFLSIFVANTVALLALTVVALVSSSFASLQTWGLFFPDQPYEFWQEHFFRRLTGAGDRLFAETGWVVAKTTLSSLLGTAMAVAIGIRRKSSVVSINNAVAQAIVLGVSLTLMAHAFVAVFQFWG